MPVFADFPLLPMGSVDEHAQYMSRFNYRYYCASCIRSIESESRLDKCVHCKGTNLILLMEKEKKESAPFSVRIAKFIHSLKKPAPVTKPQSRLFSSISKANLQLFVGAKNKEEMPTR